MEQSCFVRSFVRPFRAGQSLKCSPCSQVYAHIFNKYIKRMQTATMTSQSFISDKFNIIVVVWGTENNGTKGGWMRLIISKKKNL